METKEYNIEIFFIEDEDGYPVFHESAGSE